MLHLRPYLSKFVRNSQFPCPLRRIFQSETCIAVQQAMNASSVRYEKAGAIYKDQIYKFMMETFRTRDPAVCSLKATENDVKDIFNEMAQNGVSSGYSFVALGDGGVVGVALNSLTDANTVKSKRQEFTPIKDYGHEISSGRYGSKHANELRAFLDAIESGLKRGIGKKDDKIFKVDILCAQAALAGAGVEFRLLEMSIQEAKQLGCTIVASPVCASALQRLFSRLGFYCIREVPYFCFRDNRRVVFDNVTDGSKAGKMMTLKLMK